MRSSLVAIVVLVAAFAVVSQSCAGYAQSRGIALRSGESVEVQDVWSVVNCRSILTAPPEVEIMEGPPELTLIVKIGKVVPRRLNCSKAVDGGMIIATVGKIEQSIHGKLTYRTKYKTKDGDRQVSRSLDIWLFP